MSVLTRRTAAEAAATAAEDTTPSNGTAVLGRVLLVVIPAVWLAAFAIGFETSLVILGVLAFVLIATGLFWPGTGLLGIGMAVALDPLVRGILNAETGLPFNTFNYILLAVMLLFVPLLLRINDVNTRIFQVFMALLLVEIAFSDNKLSGLNHVLNAVTMLGMLVFFARTIRNETAKYWMGIVTGLIPAVGGVVFLQQMQNLLYVNPNAWAKFPVTGILAACLAFPAAKNFRFGRTALFLLSVVNFVWVFLSGSRGNMLIGITGLLFLLVWEQRFSWRLLAVVVLVVGGLVGVGLFAEQEQYALGRITKMFDQSYTLSQRTSGRATIAQEGLQLFLRNPMGVGTGNFLGSISEVSEFADREIQAHSGWVKVLAENGVPGILLMAMFVASFLVFGLIQGGREKLLIGILVTLTLAVAFLSTEFQGKNLWFVAAGGIVMLHDEHYRKIVSRPLSLLKRRLVRPVNAWRRDGG
jgi:O-antigen ligase